MLLVLLLLAVYIFKNNCQKENGASIRIATPTLFVHGWGSSYHAEESMVAYAQKVMLLILSYALMLVLPVKLLY
ncbi:hypothetical protein SDC49_05885 [Lactobacillus sp. R2/2]|nr:hypothetical protein [Lactobacillus sp. R2/2]